MSLWSVIKRTFEFSFSFKLLFLFVAVFLISADDLTIVDILQQAISYGFNEEYVYVIIDLENKLGPTPWIQNEYVLKIEKVRLM